ncbi:hypothetical protein [Streptomyces sp. TRM70350]|uniref:hypothetical protein n=1 Tax=Streptomyces sp. TRM70350 TaxID=2856165 RepID=UPI00210F5DC8|nr:hypothetical protein [Streptomyces sp. TRM70350]
MGNLVWPWTKSQASGVGSAAGAVGSGDATGIMAGALPAMRASRSSCWKAAAAARAGAGTSRCPHSLPLTMGACATIAFTRRSCPARTITWPPERLEPQAPILSGSVCGRVRAKVTASL